MRLSRGASRCVVLSRIMVTGVTVFESISDEREGSLPLNLNLKGSFWLWPAFLSTILSDKHVVCLYSRQKVIAAKEFLSFSSFYT